MDRVVAKVKGWDNRYDDDAPIHEPRWQDAEKANDAQAIAWRILIDGYFEKYGKSRIPLTTLVSMVLHDVRVRAENHNRMALMVERFIRDESSKVNPRYDIRAGKDGGVAKIKYLEMSSIAMDVKPGDLSYSILKPRTGQLPSDSFTITSIVTNDYTCGCGNTKCSKTEKSCWKCGAPINP